MTITRCSSRARKIIFLALSVPRSAIHARRNSKREYTRPHSALARIHDHDLRISGRRTVHVRNAVFWFIGHKSRGPKKALDFYWPQLLLIHHSEAGSPAGRAASSGHCFLHTGEFNSGFSRLAIILPFHENWYENVCNSPKCWKNLVSQVTLIICDLVRRNSWKNGENRGKMLTVKKCAIN